MRSVIFAALLFAISPASANVFLWTGSASITGAISAPVEIEIVPVLVDAGWSGSPNAYSVFSHQLTSRDTFGNVFDTSLGVLEIDNFASVLADPTAPYKHFGSFRSASTAVSISDTARLITYGGYQFTHGAGSFTGENYYFELILPDGLGVVGEQPLAPAVPEPSTWLMMILGFSSIVIFGRRRQKSAAYRLNI